MASSDFTSPEEEIHFINEQVGPVNLHRSKSSVKSCETLQIIIRKCLMLRIILPNTYPINNKNTLASVHTFDMKNLKPKRKQEIELFIEKINKNLDEIVRFNLDKIFLVKLFTHVTKCLENVDSFLDESFSVLETQTKNQTSFIIQTEVTRHESENNHKNQKKIEVNDEECDEEIKKRFKGSDFIFQRIKWDKSLDKEQIVIGYLDRFLGVKEIKFNDFKGVHEDYREGIPLHRIRHFKINDKIVWDREKRIDLLTGQDTDIHFNEFKQSMSLLNDNDQSLMTKFNIETVNSNSIFKFSNNNWCQLDMDSYTARPEFMSKFKLLTYNIMSKNNFKKSIVDLLNEHDDGNRNLGVKNLELIDRTHKYIQLLVESSPDFVMFQECDEYEEEKLRESDYVRENYFICSAPRTKNVETALGHSCLIILTKIRPAFFKILNLTENSNKQALIVKIELKTNSLKKIESLLLVNIHLTSNLAKSPEEKRKAQLETLHKYLSDMHELKTDYVFIGGDFNFGDEATYEAGLLKKYFLDNGFTDACPNIHTFDPNTNFAASITSFKDYGRRLDRILFKSNTTNQVFVDDAYLVNTAPFKINHPLIEYQRYLNIKSFSNLNRISILNDSKDLSNEFEKNSVTYTECLLNPSDHYGIECSFKFRKSLHSTNLTFKSSIAIVASHGQEIVQKIRAEHDSKFDRWPPHFNLLYPFYENIELECRIDEEKSVYGDIMNCMSQFEPFECVLNEMSTFDKNSVVFLKPNMQTVNKISEIYRALKHLFDDSNNRKWKGDFTPHMTIAQPVDKKKKSNWAKDEMKSIKEEYDNLTTSNEYCRFYVDSIYWLARTDTSPFEVKQIFPLGRTLPSTIVNLSLSELTTGDNILKFLFDKKMINDFDKEITIKTLHRTILKEIFLSVKNGLNKNEMIENKTNHNIIEYDTHINEDDYACVLTSGSFLNGIKSNDLDYIIVDSRSKDNNLVYNLAQNTQLFHVVRDVADANVPIVELCLKNCETQIENADIQIYGEFPLIEKFKNRDENNLNYDNYEFMKSISDLFSQAEQKKVFSISGFFECQNLKKYINYYKDFQILLSFVKYWAKMRQIYGKAYGYLGGISWSIMVVYFLKKSNFNSFTHTQDINNSAKRFSGLIKEFFRFYSEWNWSNVISLVDVGFVYENARSYLHKSPITILQSVYPYQNTSKNINEEYKQVTVIEIKRAFSILNSSSNNFYQIYENACKKIELNEVKQNNYIAFKIECNQSEDLNHISTLIKAKSLRLITNLQRLFPEVNFRVYPNIFNSDETNQEFKLTSFFIINVLENESFEMIKKERISNLSNEFIRDIGNLSHVCHFSISHESKLDN